MFQLNCPSGPAALRENYGFSRRDIARIKAMLTTREWRIVQRLGENPWSGVMNSKQRLSAPRDGVSASFGHCGPLRPQRGRVVVGLSNDLDVTFAPIRCRGWRTPRPRNSNLSRLRRLALAFIFPSWMRTFTCQLARRCLRFQALDRCPTRRTRRKLQERGESFSFPEQRPAGRQAEENRRQPQTSSLTAARSFFSVNLLSDQGAIRRRIQIVLRVTPVTFARDSSHGSWDTPEATLACKSEGPEPERRTLPYATAGRGERGLPCCLHTA